MFKQSTIEAFWRVFEYIETDSLTKDHGVLMWRAKDINNRKDIKINERN